MPSNSRPSLCRFPRKRVLGFGLRIKPHDHVNRKSKACSIGILSVGRRDPPCRANDLPREVGPPHRVPDPFDHGFPDEETGGFRFGLAC